MNSKKVRMSFAEYSAAPGINSTILKLAYTKSLAHVKARLDGAELEETDCLTLGTAFHTLALEGVEDFEIRPATYPSKDGPKPWNGNSLVCKQWLAEHDGANILTLDEAVRVSNMSEFVRSHPDLAGLFDGETEISVFAEHKGVPLKAMIDLLPNDPAAPVIDLKSCANAEPAAFMRDAIRLGYHLQVAFYIDILKLAGIERKKFWLVAVESEPPHAISILKFEDQDLDLMRLGRRHYRNAFSRIVSAQKTGQWPAYGAHDATMFTPPWVMKELEMA